MEPSGDELQTIHLGNWVLRVREPVGSGPYRVILMVHGWTGDENVMWVFAPRLPKDALLIAPRALYPAAEGGFSWQPDRASALSKVDEFRPAIDAILALLDKLDKGQPGFLPANYRSPSLIGFSQGAALSSMLALLHPDRIDRLAALAGFLPEDAASLVTSKPLEGKKVFIAHGTRDDRVPVERARQAVELLKQAGAQVTYCEEDVGHKLSAGCFRGLGSFFK